MIDTLLYIFEAKKSVLVVISASVLYITYYFVEVVKKPTLICLKGDFRELLESKVNILDEYFWPTPWCVESRLQTVVATLIRTYFFPKVEYRREILKLSDGGQIALDWLETEGAHATLVVVPGLTGSADADYAQALAAAAKTLPAHVVVVNYRGAAGVPLTTARLYSAVSHADLAEALAHVKARAKLAGDDGHVILAAGVSLGGLVLGHYLVETGNDSLLQAALIVSSPLDVLAGSASIESGANRALSWHMSRRLARVVRAHALLRKSHGCVQRARSIRQFDALFTAAHAGFGSLADYYAAATLRGRLHAVRTPTLCLQAADDPFQPAHALPPAEPRLALALTARGGHIGFADALWPARPPQDTFLARLAAQYFRAMLTHELPPLPVDPSGAETGPV